MPVRLPFEVRSVTRVTTPKLPPPPFIGQSGQRREQIERARYRTVARLLAVDRHDHRGIDAGLLLDEAQFVKNHQAKTYQAARLVGAGAAELNWVSVEDATPRASEFPLWAGSRQFGMRELDTSLAESWGLSARPLADSIRDLLG